MNKDAVILGLIYEETVNTEHLKNIVNKTIQNSDTIEKYPIVSMRCYDVEKIQKNLKHYRIHLRMKFEKTFYRNVKLVDNTLGDTLMTEYLDDIAIRVLKPIEEIVHPLEIQDSASNFDMAKIGGFKSDKISEHEYKTSLFYTTFVEFKELDKTEYEYNPETGQKIGIVDKDVNWRTN